MPPVQFRHVEGNAKELLLDAGLYYKINGYRFRHDNRNLSQKEFYAKVIGPDDLVFDVGANVGQRADLFSQLARKVVAFEPQASGQAFEVLGTRRNVTIEHIALSDVEGKPNLRVGIAYADFHVTQFVDTVSKGSSRTTHDREVLVRTEVSRSDD